LVPTRSALLRSALSRQFKPGSIIRFSPRRGLVRVGGEPSLRVELRECSGAFVTIGTRDRER
jgi:hypothetical protein